MPAGIGVYGTTGRLEKAYRAFGAELDQDYDVVEADMAWWKVKDEDFVGKAAHVAARGREPAATLCTLTLDDTPEARTRSAASRSCARTARRSRTRRAAARTSPPPAWGRRSASTSSCRTSRPATHGRKLYVEYMEELYPVTVDVVGSRAPFDPGQRADPLVKILVCVKRVPITGGRMVLTDDAQAIETKHLGFTISPHEECAVEEAVRIVGRGGEVVVLTLGPAEAEEQLRDCMAIGADRGILLKTDGGVGCAGDRGGDRRRRAGRGPFDLILFGNESADAGGYQVGIRVAHALGLPVVTGLKKIEVQGGAGPLRARRRAARATCTRRRCRRC